MRIGIANDHASVEMKKELVACPWLGAKMKIR